ncbi:uncharacterized protein LOC128264010 [Drosophila gunungcola]|uniref:uncharacterized protein LOC128264010 n=1 Tax=Drosophila gunungcola TaxID=103775 RepID=UPI0022E93AC2|nr:uncharacterized protein LOC128264010 [Drosophila gunungcola]
MPVDLNIGLRRNLIWPFIVADTEVAIIGADFLSHFHLLVDVKGQKLIDANTNLSTPACLSNAVHHSVSTIQGAHRFQTLLQEFVDVTVPAPKGSNHQDIQHYIETTGSPISDRPRRLSALFKELAHLMGSEHIHTTAYHPQSNGMVERWHRSFKAAMMCHSSTPWPELLPIVLLGLRNCLKEDLKSSAAEMLYGTTIRMPNEFFEDLDVNVDPATFIGDFRDLIRKIQPFEVVYRNSDRVFTLNVNGKEVAVSVDRIKPAFLANTDTQQDAQPEIAVQPRTYQNKRVQFNVS